MNLFVGVFFTDTADPDPFLLLSCVSNATDLDLWRLVGMLASFLAAPSSYLIMR